MLRRRNGYPRRRSWTRFRLTPRIDRLLAGRRPGPARALEPRRRRRGRSRCASRPDDAPLDDAERREAGALMRVNHVGEVCAQALYSAQALATRRPGAAPPVRAGRRAKRPTTWPGPPSGSASSAPGRACSIRSGMRARSASAWSPAARRRGEPGLRGRDRAPGGAPPRRATSTGCRPADHASRAIVAQMKDDEAGHAVAAEQAGAAPLPAPVRWRCALAARVMTTTAHYI